MGYSISYDQGQPVFVLIDEDRCRAVEWRYNHGPVEIVHDASPRPGAEEPMCCLHIPGFCFPKATALPLGLATLYRQAGETFDPDVHEQVHAAMRLRWAIG
jgi:hypothetical protein